MGDTTNDFQMARAGVAAERDWRCLLSIVPLRSDGIIRLSTAAMCKEKVVARKLRLLRAPYCGFWASSYVSTEEEVA